MSPLPPNLPLFLPLWADINFNHAGSVLSVIRCRVAALLPEPLSFFLRIGRFLHLLARIAEAIRVLSGIRRTSSEVAGRVKRGLPNYA